jgi:Bacterial Ig-like domain
LSLLFLFIIASSTSSFLFTSVKATFSAPLDGSTVNKTSFTLKDNKTQQPVDGTVILSGDGKTAEFKPTTNLSPSTLYVSTIGAVKDLSGNELAESVTWSFTTA